MPWDSFFRLTTNLRVTVPKFFSWAFGSADFFFPNNFGGKVTNGNPSMSFVKGNYEPRVPNELHLDQFFLSPKYVYEMVFNLRTPDYIST